MIASLKNADWKVLRDARQNFLVAFLGAMLVALASDLLYLFYAGAWYDPNKFIEVSEVGMLFGLAICGLFFMVSNLISAFNKKVKN